MVHCAGHGVSPVESGAHRLGGQHFLCAGKLLGGVPDPCGEGNGGVIYPESHYGRDALVGVGLFLSHFVAEGKSMTALKATYPQYFISKNKLTLSPDMDVDKILEGLKEKYASEEITDIDGVKIDFKDGWVHLRKSNTEPIIRVYSESKDEAAANRLAEEVIKVAKSLY